jgi:MinD superfamily P-loop ATPase
MKELVVVSGKGGTGKTSLVASFAALAKSAVLADCDVDADDLHLVVEPEIKEKHDFYGGHKAVINQSKCNACGTCLDVCRFEAIMETQDESGEFSYSVDPALCEGCGCCVQFCSNGAVDFPEKLCGVWMVSQTRFGPMIHARLATAAENSGKLVSTVRQAARRAAEKAGRELILIDGPPGIGCQAIASITGASQALVVTEPTLAGAHDLQRVLSLIKHFGMPTAVCVNKWDINPEIAEQIERQARASNAKVVGRIRYDPAVTKAQMQARAIVEIDAPSAADIRSVWRAVMQTIEKENVR